MASNLSKLVIPVLFVLSGCQLQQAAQAPLVDTKYQTIEKPIMVPCKVDIPDEPVDLVVGLKTSDDVFYKAKNILADRENRRAYEAKLKGALQTCNQSK